MCNICPDSPALKIIRITPMLRIGSYTANARCEYHDNNKPFLSHNFLLVCGCKGINVYSKQDKIAISIHFMLS